MAAKIDEKGWEESDFPVVCETCLGENPYVRMSRQPFGKACKICQRPFTVFRWCPGKNMRIKRTEICVTCCKLKNICSTCALDLDLSIFYFDINRYFNGWLILEMPTRIRDLALGLKDPIAKQNINREFSVQNIEASMNSHDGKTDAGLYGRLGAPGREALKKIAESEPYKRRLNMAERNEEQVNLREGYADPMGRKDRSITTLFVTGIPENTTDDELRTYFGVWGDIKSAVSVSKKRCAFVTFETRRSAETAQFSGRDGFTFKGTVCYSNFAKPKQQGPKIEPLMKIIQKDEQDKEGGQDQRPVIKSAIPLPPGVQAMTYPSQLTKIEGSSRKAALKD